MSEAIESDYVLWRETRVGEVTGWKATSRWSKRKEGLLPMPIKVGELAMTPAHEVIKINRARIAGASDDEVRALVKQLHAALGCTDSTA